MTQDGYLAVGTALPYRMAVAIGPDGAMYVGQDNGIYKMAVERPTLSAGLVEYPSEDAREVYEFTPTGQHLRTIDAITNVTTASFGYAGGVLAWIRDASGRQTTITRSGLTTSIQAPFGQVTTLRLDAAGNVAELAGPDGNSYAFAYQAGGLMDSCRTPREYTSTYRYGADGRLVSDGGSEAVSEPDGAGQTFRLQDSGTARTVDRTTKEGRRTTYSLSQNLDGRRQRSVTGPDGSIESERTWFLATLPYGEVDSYFSPDGDSTQTRPVRDERFGWLAPFDATSSTVLPVSHRPMNRTQSRTWSGGHYRESVTMDWSKTYTADYDTNLRTLTWKTPMQRLSTITLDGANRPVETSSDGMLPIDYYYYEMGT